MPEILRVLPHHFEPICINGVWTIPCPEVDIKITLDKRHKNTDGFKDLGKFEDLPVLISGLGGNDLGSVDNPLPSKSSDSDAGYLAWYEQEVGEEKVLIAVQMLKEFTMTSHHTHESSREVFRRLVGTFYNYHNQEVVRVEDRLRIQPGDSHLSFTTDIPVLTLLVQRGQDIKHDYLVQPDYQYLRMQAELLDKRLVY